MSALRGAPAHTRSRGPARSAARSVSAPFVSSTRAQITGEQSGGTGGLGWGWLRGTVRVDVATVRELLGRYLGEVIDQDHGARWYERLALVGTRGSAIAWAPRAAPVERELEVCFSITQGDCDALGFLQVAQLARELIDLGAHFTRADAYYDDRRRVVDPRVVLDAFRAGRCVTHMRKSSLIDDGEDGVTAYLGKRGKSEIFIRVYDKDAEQQVEVGTHGVRWEIQANDERAGWLVHLVLLAPQGQQAGRFAAALVGLVDFRERVGIQNGDRAPRLDWWQQLVADAAAARMRAVEVVDSLVKRARWVARQVAPTLGLLLLANEGDLGWLVAACKQGVRRLGRQQLALLEPELRPGWGLRAT